MQINMFNVQFSEYIPEELQEGVLYISMEYATASHKCACGCGKEVVTPFTPTDWKLTYDGESVSISPSIGNWSYPCRSHYFIRNNRIVWANDMTDEAIAAGRIINRAKKTKHYAKDAKVEIPKSSESRSQASKSISRIDRFLSAFVRLLGFK